MKIILTLNKRPHIELRNSFFQLFLYELFNFFCIALFRMMIYKRLKQSKLVKLKLFSYEDGAQILLPEKYPCILIYFPLNFHQTPHSLNQSKTPEKEACHSIW